MRISNDAIGNFEDVRTVGALILQLQPRIAQNTLLLNLKFSRDAGVAFCSACLITRQCYRLCNNLIISLKEGCPFSPLKGAHGA